MDKQGNKTGGRKKGTPNRVNASIKVRIKDFLLKNEDHMLEAFLAAKPNEKLNFWYKMTNLVCAKQTSSKDDGEWRPGEGIDPDWMTGYERYKQQMEDEEYAYQQEYTEKFKEEKKEIKYRNEFYKAAKNLITTVSSNEFMKKAEKQYGQEQFWGNLENLIMTAVAKELESQDIYPPKQLQMHGTVINPKSSNQPQPTESEESIITSPSSPSSESRESSVSREPGLSRTSNESTNTGPSNESSVSTVSRESSLSRTSNESTTTGPSGPSSESRPSSKSSISMESIPPSESPG